MIDSNLTYETAMARVDEIKKSIESGRTPLHETMNLFREAQELLTWVDADLSACEREAQELIARADGGFELVDVASPPHATAA